MIKRAREEFEADGFLSSVFFYKYRPGERLGGILQSLSMGWDINQKCMFPGDGR